MQIDLQPPKNLNEFFPWLKEESEKLWATTRPNSTIPAGMKWLPGLTDRQIADYEQEMGFFFPKIYRMYLRCMNGTEEYVHTWRKELSGWSEYGYPAGSIKSKVTKHLFHSYPRDIKEINNLIDGVCGLFRIKQQELSQKGIPHIMPIRGGIFLIMSGSEINPVFTPWPNEYRYESEDTVLLADSLNNYLYSYFFDWGQSEKPIPNDVIATIYSQVKCWLDNPVLIRKWGVSEVRQIRLATIIRDNYDSFGDYDFGYKARIIRRFLTDAKRVRVSVIFEGRKNRHPEIGMELLQNMIQVVKEWTSFAKIERPPALDKKEYTMLLAPLLANRQD